MEMLQQYGWLAVMVLAIVVEAISLGLTSVWFAFGALAAWLVSLVVDSFAIQITVVLGSFIGFVDRNSAICSQRTEDLGVIGPMLMRWWAERGFVLKAIEPLSTTGQVKVGAQIWTAVSDESLTEGVKVQVLEIQGVKLVVKRADKEEA